MPEILSTNLKSDLNRLFLEQSRASEDYYLFVSSIGPFDPSDSLFSKNELDNCFIFLKQEFELLKKEILPVLSSMLLSVQTIMTLETIEFINA